MNSFGAYTILKCCLHRNLVTFNSTVLIPRRTTSSTSMRNALFDAELKRQRENIGRIEKINVDYCGLPDNVTLVMTKYVSTPFNVAQHLSDWVMSRSALALVDEAVLWDMHRPLDKDCSMQLLHFADPDPHHVNKAFWRMCCFLLGAVASNAFSETITASLHSFPSPNVKSGSFVYDVYLSVKDWKPNGDELRVLSAEFVKLVRQNLPLERLSVSSELATEMFEDNHFKKQQIPGIANSNPQGEVILYRAGDHIDISRGPMVGHTGLIGRATVTAVHMLETEDGLLYRFQGVALPTGIRLNHFAYGILEERARKLDTICITQASNLKPAPYTALCKKNEQFWVWGMHWNNEWILSL